MITFDQEQPFDALQIEDLYDTAFGTDRHLKTSYALRANNPLIPNLSLVVRKQEKVIASVRFSPVHVHDMLTRRNSNAVLLGPLAVSCGEQGQGIGAQLMAKALAGVRAAGHKRVFLVGDIEYYHRFGFESVLPSFITLPNGKERRLLIAQPATVNALPAVGKLRAGYAREAQAKDIPRFGELASAA